MMNMCFFYINYNEGFNCVFAGSRLLVGDVVWGKIMGFPWWPGKVLTITTTDNQLPQAQVAWYGSCTSSLMECDQLCPYLETFKVRFKLFVCLIISYMLKMV